MHRDPVERVTDIDLEFRLRKGRLERAFNFGRGALLG
jgi:hypothetical protein